MLVDMDRSRNRYRENSKNDDRAKRGNYRGNRNGNYSFRISPSINKDYSHHSTRTLFNSRDSSLTYHRHRDDDYPPENRIGNGSSQSNYYDNHSSSSSRFDRQSNNRDIYPLLLPDQPMLTDDPPQISSYYNSSQSIPPARDRGLPPPSSRNRSSTYRRASSPPQSSFRNERSTDFEYRSNANDLYNHDEYQPPVLTSLPVRSNVDSYGDMYRSSDYNNRSERHNLPPNRNGSSRDYSIAAIPSPVYHTDPYRTASVIPMTSSYVARDQFTQSFPSMHEVNYRTRDYEMNHHQSVSNNSSGNRSMDYHSSSSSYRDRLNLKRSRDHFNDNELVPSKRSMRRE